MNFFIVAIDENWGIAKDHQIPWHYKEDFAFFKEKTTGTACIMGYNTYAEIAAMRKFPEKNKELLPGRDSYIVTSKESLPAGCTILKIGENISLPNKPLAFIGGISIYDYAMSNLKGIIDCGYITRIKHNHNCNLFFNKSLLNKNFELSEIINETDDLRFEKWTRINTKD